MGRLVLVVIFCTLLFAGTRANSAYTSVVKSLFSFQENGGFLATTTSESPTLRATSDALLLAGLYGLDVDEGQLTSFIRRLANGDSGYGRSAGMASDLASVKDALISFKNLGSAVPNPLKVANFVRSLYDPKTSLFRLRSGGESSIRATALAYEIFEILGELEASTVKEYSQKILPLVAAADKGDHFEFGTDKSLSKLSSNYDGIVLSHFVGYNIKNSGRWVSFITSQQRSDGGFGDLETTLDAVRSLVRLGGVSDIKDTEALRRYYLSVPEDISAVAAAHSIAVLTNTHRGDFDAELSFEGVRGQVIIQGSQVKPVVRAPKGLKVDLAISAKGKEISKQAVNYDALRASYISSASFDSAPYLGDLLFTINARKTVAGLGEVNLDFTAPRSVGYGVSVTPTAKMGVTGKRVRPGAKVNLGTQFDFEYKFHNDAQTDIKSGDFEVVFRVLDSSLVEIHSASIDGKTNTNPITFSYTLTKSDLPAGSLIFRVEIKSAEGVHTVHDTTYSLSVAMVASDITFTGRNSEQPSYRIGETVSISITPGSYPDLRNVYPYTSLNQRKFALDIKTPEGTLIKTVPGTTTSDGKSVLFETVIPALLSSLGTNVVTFRYIPAFGESVQLSNFNNVDGELLEDALTFKVTAELQLSDVTEKPSSFSFNYGNVAKFSFKVKDLQSNQYLVGSDASTVYLELEHSDESKGTPFISAEEPAVNSGETFQIQWEITPNAVRGKGKLRLVARDADSNSIALLDDKKKAFNLDATIGGDIAVDRKTYSTSHCSRCLSW
eukprot:TRINITY_DN5355_c0_g1_i2.p1 TRINITY_DN5355_c0_g1~~TRINITY_DN5355_c0_g1_i2.p1  ORF type:complete len:781 (-),score=221.18 TRINITY_DN5355_c0_g1_i2:448-2790(-)